MEKKKTIFVVLAIMGILGSALLVLFYIASTDPSPRARSRKTDTVSTLPSVELEGNSNWWTARPKAEDPTCYSNLSADQRLILTNALNILAQLRHTRNSADQVFDPGEHADRVLKHRMELANILREDHWLVWDCDHTLFWLEAERRPEMQSCLKNLGVPNMFAAWGGARSNYHNPDLRSEWDAFFHLAHTLAADRFKSPVDLSAAWIRLTTTMNQQSSEMIHSSVQDIKQLVATALPSNHCGAAYVYVDSVVQLMNVGELEMASTMLDAARIILNDAPISDIPLADAWPARRGYHMAMAKYYLISDDVEAALECVEEYGRIANFRENQDAVHDARLMKATIYAYVGQLGRSIDELENEWNNNNASSMRACVLADLYSRIPDCPSALEWVPNVHESTQEASPRFVVALLRCGLLEQTLPFLSAADADARENLEPIVQFASLLRRENRSDEEMSEIANRFASRDDSSSWDTLRNYELRALEHSLLLCSGRPPGRPS